MRIGNQKKLQKCGRQRMERIGILGGTFNPVHCGHLMIAEKARNKMGLGEVIFVPSARPPHKDACRMPSAADRHRMVKDAVKGRFGFSVSDMELKRKGKSYTVDTVRAFKRSRPGAKLFFIIGSDTLPEVKTWKDHGDILKMCGFIVANRPGSGRPACPPPGMKLSRIRVRGMDISSSVIREKISKGSPAGKMVPPAVEKYIAGKKLYSH